MEEDDIPRALHSRSRRSGDECRCEMYLGLVCLSQSDSRTAELDNPSTEVKLDEGSQFAQVKQC